MPPASRAASAERTVKGLDAAIRLIYKLAFPIWCWLLRVSGHRLFGALVLIWCDGRLLMLMPSYQDKLQLPGGQAKRGEDSRAAALRELVEEIGLRVAPEALRFECAVDFNIRGLRGLDHIYAIDFERPPPLVLDQREIIAAHWLSPQQALELIVEPQIRELIADRAG